MKATFVEVNGFRDDREDYLPDADYARLQQLLMVNPDAGDVMPGCGGLRKIRIGDVTRGKGKRGGARVIYLYVSEARRFLMVQLYGKAVRDSLSGDEKRILKSLADVYKQVSISQYRRWWEEKQK